MTTTPGTEGPEPSRSEKVLGLRDLYLQLATAPVAEVEQAASAELAQLLEFISANSDWWRDRLGATVALAEGVPLAEAIRSLPITERDTVQDSAREMRILIPGTTPSDYVAHATSGATGTPRQVIKHRELYSMARDAITLLEWNWFDRDVSATLVAFGANDPDADLLPGSPPLTYLGPASAWCRRGITNRDPGTLLDFLEELAPTYLLCNGLTLRLLALEQLIHPRAIVGLEQVLTLCDRIDASTRALVVEAFGARICDRYSTEEFGIIALQCPAHDHLHVVAPSFVVEIVDPLGEPCPPGVAGEVLITSLHDFAQPLIRYQIGDIAQWGAPCDAGITWPVIEAIHGRTRQVVTGPTGQPRLVTLVGADFLTLPELLDFRIALFTDTVVFMGHTREPLTGAQAQRVERSVRSVFPPGLDYVYLPADASIREQTWKRSEFDVVDEPFDSDLNAAEVLERVIGASSGA